MIKLATAREPRVRDVMTSYVVTVPFTATVGDAVRTLHESRVSGAPVLGSSGRILGIVSRADLLDPRHAANPELPVPDVMTRVIFAVRADDPLSWALRLMVEERIHRVMVTDDEGRLVGILVPMDILRAMVPLDGAGAANELGFSYVDLRRSGNGAE